MRSRHQKAPRPDALIALQSTRIVFQMLILRVEFALERRLRAPGRIVSKRRQRRLYYCAVGISVLPAREFRIFSAFDECVRNP